MKPVTVVCISDTHLNHNFIVPDGDILIHSGDATYQGTVGEVTQFAQWFLALPHKHKIFVPGNHDWLFEVTPEEARKLLPGVHVLIDEPFEIEGLKIYGSPWTPTFFDWSFMEDETALKERWKAIPQDLDILITHGPAYSILDWNKQGKHCGSQSLFDAVVQKNPKYHVFGHIHEASGISVIGSRTHVNAAILNDRYKLSNEPQVIRIGEDD